MIVRAQPEAISHSRQPYEFHDRMMPMLTERLLAPEFMIQEEIEVLMPREVPNFTWLFGQLLGTEPRGALNGAQAACLPSARCAHSCRSLVHVLAPAALQRARVQPDCISCAAVHHCAFGAKV
jgi:hypothetical protein